MGTSIPFNSSFYISSFSNLVNLFFAHWRGKVKKANCGSGRKYQKRAETLAGLHVLYWMKYKMFFFFSEHVLQLQQWN